MSRKRRSLPSEPVVARIENMTQEGKGVARIAGKTVFIDDALPGEQVEFVYTRSRRNYDEGRLHQVLEAAPARIEPACDHFGLCGGCRLQHVSSEEQVRLKQQILLEDLARIGHVTPQTVLPPLTGPVWGYRNKARLGVRYVDKKEKVLVGFRERGSHFLAQLQHCKILTPPLGDKLVELGELIGRLSCYRRIPQIEVAADDEKIALVFRNLEPLTEADRALLVDYGKTTGFVIYHQPEGPESITLLYPQQATLRYSIPQFDVSLEFQPADFIQVNSDINRRMISQALQWLEPQATDRILELFCGLGNFSLPLARHGGDVVSVEGEAQLIERARANAASNGIENVRFHVANLFEPTDHEPWIRGQQYDKVLLDPPRSGAAEIVPYLAASGARRIVYVSCNPATLARDAGELVNRHGYRLQQVGMMDMFPHTAHVETMALFTKGA
ncbi:23S rRNA (uracil(1939)-C(5))-methyltransferase RlmD [Thiohalophilus thiocyanatoxydans]|uniref:23S rRNA (uracil(1939)-C(5))-methyltransferase RlmD n=1 Tax=Thiohalophilus thiocyanatoxydans TaxID=381308 RepID=A0A4R8IYG1_9GAMM|nr:23S rRNA (uracil(1939)-C(5))-methyltransferase RlmD [Thiohalophilus thiocyanatoxydans]TDY02977.1 23S rRNA m(5)U-1939 methyltransferase [Thiohalophilus thiocyanatoxydans]